jgi:hypothetical protein
MTWVAFHLLHRNKTKMKKLFLIIVALFFWICSINAQIDSTNSIIFMQKERTKNADVFKVKSFTPSGESILSNIISNASLTSSYNGGINGKVEFKYNKDWLTFGFSANQSIGNNSKEATPMDLSGISAGTTLEFNIQKMFWNPAVSNTFFKKFEKAKHEFANRMMKDERGVTLEEILKDTTGNEKLLLKNVVLKKPWFFNVSYSLRNNDYSYVTDSLSLKDIKKSYLNPIFKLSIGKPFSNKTGVVGYLGFSYIYSITYLNEDELTLLKPFGTTDNYLLKTVNFGEPEKNIDNRLCIEFRRNFENSLAISPSIIYGINSKKFAIIFPIYLIKSSTDKANVTGLQGGIRLSYNFKINNSEISPIGKGYGAQLVITAPFEILESSKK